MRIMSLFVIVPLAFLIAVGYNGVVAPQDDIAIDNPAPRGPEHVGIRGWTFRDSVSVNVDIQWSAVLDRRGNPVAAYTVELREVPPDTLLVGSSLAGTVLRDTLNIARPLPGDSLMFYVRVHAVDDRGVAGTWGTSDTLTIMNPDLLGPDAPTVLLDTIPEQAASVIGISSLWFTNGVVFDSAATSMFAGTTRQASVILSLSDGTQECYGDPAFCSWKGVPFISALFPRFKPARWLGL